MGPGDIHRIDDGPPRVDHITLQYLIAPDNYNPILGQALIYLAENAGEPTVPIAHFRGFNVDARFPITGDPAHNVPPSLLLDFLYGAAAYRLWKSASLHDVVKKYHEENFSSITPGLPRSKPSYPRRGGDEPVGSNPSGNYQPLLLETAHLSRPTYGLSEAMDDLGIVGMIVKGITPQEAAKRREERRREDELLAQKASQHKVTEWMKALD